MTFCMNFPLEIITQYNLAVVSNCQEIGLLDWYPLSETDLKNIENTRREPRWNGIENRGTSGKENGRRNEKNY